MVIGLLSSTGPSNSPGKNDNERIDVALGYHEATKHSSISIRTKPHYLDFENQPSLYKAYLKIRPIHLPRDFPFPDMKALDAIGKSDVLEGMKELDSRLLAQVLYYSAGITRRIRFSWGVFPFRAASSAGALYPVEVYVVCKDIPGLDAGVYYFHPEEFNLRELRKGDFRDPIARGSFDKEAVSSAPVTMVFTAIFWKSAWKYLARAYRYCYWDCGTMLANTLAVTSSSKIPAKVVTGFVDNVVNKVLGIDGMHEGALCLVPLGRSGGGPEPPPSFRDLSCEIAPISKYEVEYPEIHQLHASSSLKEPKDVAAWIQSGQGYIPATLAVGGRDEASLSVYALRPIQDLSSIPKIGEVIRKRGSTRIFSKTGIPFEQLSTILEFSTTGIPADSFYRKGYSLIDTYLILNAVDGLPSGAYFFSAKERQVELLKKGSFREVAGYLCLDQALSHDASAVLFFMSDLEKVLKFYGNRGYRLAHLEAGNIGGKAYLCSYALGIGATGLTFYDDDVMEFFSPHAKKKDAIFVVAVGLPLSKKAGNS